MLRRKRSYFPIQNSVEVLSDGSVLILNSENFQETIFPDDTEHFL